MLESCLGFAQEWLWCCLGVAQVLLRSCSGVTLELLSSCSGVAQKLLWRSLGVTCVCVAWALLESSLSSLGALGLEYFEPCFIISNFTSVYPYVHATVVRWVKLSVSYNFFSSTLSEWN